MNLVPQPRVVRWTRRLEEATALDGVVRAVEPTVQAAFGTGSRASVLRGEWLGHAVHPILTDLVIGSWTSASLLDLVGGRLPPVPPRSSSGSDCSQLLRPSGPAGPSGRPSVSERSGSASCTR